MELVLDGYMAVGSCFRRLYGRWKLALYDFDENVIKFTDK